MGRDEHNHTKGKRSRLAQTPKYEMKSDGRDIEFSEEFADQNDKEAQARSKEADRRAKRRH